MFDIGFWELALIAVVALLVIGPERLPGVARTAGLWLGKARSFIASVKADVDRELKAEELKRIMEKQAELPGLHDIIEETREAARAPLQESKPQDDSDIIAHDPALDERPDEAPDAGKPVAPPRTSDDKS